MTSVAEVNPGRSPVPLSVSRISGSLTTSNPFRPKFSPTDTGSRCAGHANSPSCTMDSPNTWTHPYGVPFDLPLTSAVEPRVALKLLLVIHCVREVRRNPRVVCRPTGSGESRIGMLPPAAIIRQPVGRAESFADQAAASDADAGDQRALGRRPAKRGQRLDDFPPDGGLPSRPLEGIA